MNQIYIEKLIKNHLHETRNNLNTKEDIADKLYLQGMIHAFGMILEEIYLKKIEHALGAFEENERKEIKVFDKKDNVETTVYIEHVTDGIDTHVLLNYPGKGITSLDSLFNEAMFEILDERFNLQIN